MVGERLLSCIRENDTVARLGGDEFVVVMEQVNNREGVTQLAYKLMETLGTRFEIQGQILFVTTSIGISLFPRDGKDSEVLLKNADAAMYQAKERGRSNFVFYTRELTVTAYDRVMLEGSLRQALDQEEFILYYQPQISLTDGTVTGVEALIRWDHPKLGLLPPSRFLPVAEESGLIVQIGEWVLKTACRQMHNWHMSGLKLPHVAVNVSGKQIRKGDLVERVHSVLQETECRPEWLELEISEDFIMKETEPSIQTLVGLRALGTHLAIDDFGTGYSSLSYLKRLPIDKLKIDRTFIRDLNRDPNDAAIVRAIIAMGKGLQLKIIAEGVESEIQEQFLRSHDCDEMQGFRYGRPMSAARIQQRFGSNMGTNVRPVQLNSPVD
jgi:predicted signal transduction protein with EAL and GGDEF domain